MSTMRKARARQLAVTLLAALVALPARAGAPNYDAFSDRDGRITTREHGLGMIKLVRSAADLEVVFEDSRRGSPRAKRVFDELETSSFPDTGRELAEMVSRPPCLVPVLRELSGWCVPDWSFLDFLSKEEQAGVRLRVALLNGYLERARQRNLENQLILSAMAAILGVEVAVGALSRAGIAVSVSRTPEAPGAVTAGPAAEGSANREATGFLGSKRAPLANAPYQQLQNGDAVIGGRTFSGHALDQMRNRGLMPAVVENAIQTGVRSADPIIGRTRYFDPVNKVTIITERERVITVIPGMVGP